MRNALRNSVAALLLLAMAFAAVAPANATDKSYIRIKNDTDKYVWVTVYSKPSGLYSKQEGAWCIAPGAPDDHGLSAVIKEVRVEVSAGGCQRTPMVLDKTWTVMAREINQYNDLNFYGFVKLTGGFYIFTH